MVRAPLKINMESLQERKEYKRHKVNQGDNVYRILPPFGEQANGYPFKAWTLAWLPDPQTGRNRPYASPRSFGEKECPIAEYVWALDAKVKNLAKDEANAELVSNLTKVIINLKPKTSYFYNATNKAGEVGILELKKTAHDGLKKEIMQYITDYGQDPSSLNADENDSGVWFKVRREGEGKNTEYSVTKNQTKQKINGQLVFVDDRSELPQNIVDSYDSLGYDLTTLYKKVNYNDLKDVLLSALSVIYQQIPEAVIPGFELEQAQVQKTQAPVAKPTATTTKVALKLDEEDVVDEDEPVLVKAKPAAKKVSNSTDDDVFANALNLLNS